MRNSICLLFSIRISIFSSFFNRKFVLFAFFRFLNDILFRCCVKYSLISRVDCCISPFSRLVFRVCARAPRFWPLPNNMVVAIKVGKKAKNYTQPHTFTALFVVPLKLKQQYWTRNEDDRLKWTTREWKKNSKHTTTTHYILHMYAYN